MHRTRAQRGQTSTEYLGASGRGMRTNSAATPGAPKKPRSDNSKEHSCNDAEGAPTGEFRSQFGYIVDTGSVATADLLDDIQDFFASMELAVNASRIPDDPPAVFAEGSGFSYSAILNSVGELVVGGTTPCFPPE